MNNKWLKIAWRSVVRNKRRSMTAVLTIAIAAAAMIAAYGFLTFTFWGLKTSIIQGGAGNYQVMTDEFINGFEETPMEFGIPNEVADKLVTDLEAKSDIKLVTPRVSFAGLVSYGEITAIFQGQGIVPKKEDRMRAGNPAGSYIEGRSIRGDNIYQVGLAEQVAKKLNVHVGDMVTVLGTTQYGGINALDAEISGIYTTGIPERDAIEIQAPLDFAQELMEADRITRLVVQLRDMDATDIYRSTMESMIGDDKSTRTWYEIEPYFIAVQQVYYGIFTFMGVILTAVVLLSVYNVLSTTVLERVAEIGTLRAFGISESRITRTFMTEGFIIGVIGSLLGVILSVVLLLVINNLGVMLPPPPGRSQEYPLMVFLEPLGMLVVGLLMVLIGAAASMFAVRKVVKKKVVEQLSHV